MSTILITGGTGLIGSALSHKLISLGHKVIILTRKQNKEHSSLSYAEWDVQKQYIDPESIKAADAIIHLAGANVAEKRWTEKRKNEILASRVETGKLIIQSLKKIPNKITCLISASAIGWYGPDPLIPNPSPFIEENPNYTDFLGTTCKAWEDILHEIKQLNKRLVIFRTGIVLSNNGGAFTEFKKPLKFGFATILGNGSQIISWIHINDLVKLYVSAIENNLITGIYNAVSPEPVSNRKLMMELKSSANRFSIPIRIPSFVLKATLGEMSREILKSCTVSCDKLKEIQFDFEFPTIEKAINNLMHSK